jgi:ketosteroid isomerase-like protein
MTESEATRFAEEWIAAWNSHDLERILSHYSEDIVFLSPVAARRVGNGRVKGIEALRAYWSVGLSSQPDLHFKLEQVLTGHDCLTILYTNHRGQRVSETCEFAAGGKVARSFACYA